MADELKEEHFQELIQTIRESTQRQVAAIREIQEGFSNRAAKLDALAIQIDSKLSEYRSRIEELKASGPQPDDASEHKETVERLTSSQEASIAEIKDIQEALQSAKTEIDELKRVETELNQRKEAIEEKAKKDLPRTRMKIQVYFLVSRINWDYDAGDRIKGEVQGQRPGESKGFDFDPAAEATWSIADKLWDLI